MAGHGEIHSMYSGNIKCTISYWQDTAILPIYHRAVNASKPLILTEFNLAQALVTINLSHFILCQNFLLYGSYTVYFIPLMYGFIGR